MCPSADALQRFSSFRSVAAAFAAGICCQPHACFVSPHRPGAVYRVDIQPVVAPRRPSLVSCAQAAPAAGAPGRNAALLRFELNRDGLSAIPVLKLTPRVAATKLDARIRACRRRGFHGRNSSPTSCADPSRIPVWGVAGYVRSRPHMQACQIVAIRLHFFYGPGRPLRCRRRHGLL